MESFDPLTWASEDWFATPVRELPEKLRKRIAQVFAPMPWDELSTDQRDNVVLQLDYQNDPTTEQDQKFWCDLFQRVVALKKQIAGREVVATANAPEVALKKSRLAQLRQELAHLDSHQRLCRGEYFAERKPSQGSGWCTRG